MKIIKLVLTVFIVFFVAFSIGAVCQADTTKTMTNADLADTLVKVLGLEMPEGTEDLTDLELFRAQAMVLEANDITNFVDADPNAFVTRGELADILYTLLVGTFDLEPQAKLDFVTYLGYVDTGDLEDILSYDEIIAALNNPAIAGIVIEGYASPGEKGVGDIGEKGVQAPEQMNPQPENPASQVR